MNEEVLLIDLESIKTGFLSIIDGLLVVRIPANEWAEPTTQGCNELSVGEGQPSYNGGIVLLCLAEESCFLILGGDYE